MKTIKVISDWAGDSVLRAIFQTYVEGFSLQSNYPQLTFIECASQTLNGGFLLNHLANVEMQFGRPLDTVICIDFSDNTRRLNKGEEKLFIIKLKSGVTLIGMNISYAFSFIREEIEVAYEYKNVEADTNREKLTRIIAHVAENMEKDLDMDEVHVNLIPFYDKNTIAHIGSSGEVITTVTENQIKGVVSFEGHVDISIGSTKVKTRYVANKNNEVRNEPLLYPSSYQNQSIPYLAIDGLPADLKLHIGDEIKIASR